MVKRGLMKRALVSEVKIKRDSQTVVFLIYRMSFVHLFRYELDKRCGRREKAC